MTLDKFEDRGATHDGAKANKSPVGFPPHDAPLAVLRLLMQYSRVRLLMDTMKTQGQKLLFILVWRMEVKSSLPTPWTFGEPLGKHALLPYRSSRASTRPVQ